MRAICGISLILFVAGCGEGDFAGPEEGFVASPLRAAREHYNVSPKSTDKGDGTWGALLRMEASVKEDTGLGEFVIYKKNEPFQSNGTMYIMRDSCKEPEDNWLFGHNWLAIDDRVKPGNEFSLLTAMVDYEGTYAYYGRFESRDGAGGHVCVGPINITMAIY
jgi:hypothetical protein